MHSLTCSWRGLLPSAIGIARLLCGSRHVRPRTSAVIVHEASHTPIEHGIFACKNCRVFKRVCFTTSTSIFTRKVHVYTIKVHDKCFSTLLRNIIWSRTSLDQASCVASGSQSGVARVVFFEVIQSPVVSPLSLIRLRMLIVATR